MITVQMLLIVLGLGLIALLLDAWRISRPPDLARRHRLAFSVLNMALALSVRAAWWPRRRWSRPSGS